MCRFIHANEGGVYIHEQVTQIFFDLQISRKRGLKKAYDVLSAASIQKFDWSITLHPIGVYGLQYR